MTDVIRFALLGLGTGGIYALLALGIVIIHRGSGVINFGHGAIAMIGTFVFWDMYHNHGMPYVLAGLIGIAASAALGALFQYLILRRLRASSTLTKMIATLALLAVLQQAANLIWGPNLILVNSLLPTGNWKFAGGVVGEDRVLLFAVAAIVTAILWAVYRYTAFGRITAASAENASAAQCLGYSSERIATINWAVGSGLAAFAGVLLAPVTGIQISQFTLLVLPALAGAIVGQLASFPLAFLGGAGIGIAQSEIGRYVQTQGWSEAIPFLMIILILIIRGRRLRLRSTGFQRLPRAGTGRVRWGVLLPVVIISILVIQLWLNSTWLAATTQSFGVATILLSILVIVGYTGQLSLAQMVIAGCGALFAARFVVAGVPFLFAVILAVICTLPVGLLLGGIALRTRGPALAVATLAFAVCIESIVFNNQTYTGGNGYGVPVGSQSIFGWSIDAYAHPQRYTTIVFCTFVVLALAVANLRRGRSGRRLVATRANERAASSLGINIIGTKLYAFCLGTAFAAIGGALLAFQNTTVVFDDFSSTESINLLTNSVLGGVGLLVGMVIGGIADLGALGTVIVQQLFGSANWLPFILACLTLQVIVAAPDGLAKLHAGHFAYLLDKVPGRLFRPSEDKFVAGSSEEQSITRVQPKALQVSGLSVQFGGVKALTNLSLTVSPGTIVGLIGPNGAGKTTFIDAVTGYVSARTGEVQFAGESVTKRSSMQRSRRGLARTFQSLELFEDMTVLENIRVASEKRSAIAYLADLVWVRTPELSPIARATIKEFGLESLLGMRPEDLSYGQRRLVGIARAVAMEPSVLMLDEPAAGLDSRESAELGHLIRRLARDWGMGVLLIEHDVELVMSISEQVHVIDFGREIASGSPDQVRANPDVIAAYLGGAVEAEPT